MDKSFWKNKSILITGFEGFLGSNLTQALIGSNAKIVGLDIKVRRKDTILTSADYKKIAVVKGSVTNHVLLRNIMRDNGVDIVFHLAAEAIVGCSQKNPLRAFKTNIAGTWAVLEAARNNDKIEAIVVASSDKAYGSHKKLPYREDTPLIGDHPYDVSKSCADLIAYTYANTYGLPVAITRCGNIYGPGDFHFSRIVPDAMRCVLLDKTLHIRSDGNFIRDYIYVDDIVAGYIRIAELVRKKNFLGEAFNLSAEEPVSVVELLKEINRSIFCGGKLKYKILNTAKYEIKEQYLSSLKARRILSWKPGHSLREGIRKTGKWYAEHFNKR